MKQKEKIKEFSNFHIEDLQRLQREKKELLRKFRFDLAAGKVKNVREIRETRKDIARLLTFVNK